MLPLAFFQEESAVICKGDPSTQGTNRSSKHCFVMRTQALKSHRSTLDCSWVIQQEPCLCFEFLMHLQSSVDCPLVFELTLIIWSPLYFISYQHLPLAYWCLCSEYEFLNFFSTIQHLFSQLSCSPSGLQISRQFDPIFAISKSNLCWEIAKTLLSS